MDKKKLIKALEYIETKKHNVSERNKILTINLIRYIETGNYYNMFGILNQELEDVCEAYEELYKNRLLNILKQKNIFLFSIKYKEIEDIELSEGYKKCCGIGYIELLNLFKENKYEDIYKMIDNDIIYYINDKIPKNTEKELKIDLHYEKLKNKLHECEQKKEDKITEPIHIVIEKPKIILKKNIFNKDTYKLTTDKIEDKLDLKKEKIPNYSLEWEDCIIKEWRESTYKIFMRHMKLLLKSLKQDTTKCNLKIFTEEDTFDKVIKILHNNPKKYKLNTIISKFKALTLYIINFIPKTDIILEYNKYNKYLSHLLDLVSKNNIETKNKKINLDIIDYTEIIKKCNEILSTDNDDIIKILCYIYKYGFDDPTKNPIGVLRPGDLLNTIITNEYNKDIIYNQLAIKDKIWYFNENLTKNATYRTIILDDEFINNITKLTEENNFLLGFTDIRPDIICDILYKNGLPNTNMMRASCEIYTNKNYKLKEGINITNNLGHTSITNLMNYNVMKE